MVQEPISDEAFIAALEKVLTLSIATSHPHFNNQLYGAPDPIGIVADWAVVVLNSNCHTYEVTLNPASMSCATINQPARISTLSTVWHASRTSGVHGPWHCDTRLRHIPPDVSMTPIFAGRARVHTDGA
jgi:hypothetical protein